MKILPQEFYLSNPSQVAVALLGKKLVRKIGNYTISGIIVETEAYYGKSDPASRARKGGKLSKIMLGPPGRTLIYMVHGNWLLNIVTCPKGVAGAVLIRAIEPLSGLSLMMRNRGINDVKKLTNGPGRLTKALNITNKLNNLPVFDKKSEITIYEGRKISSGEIAKSFRIGVSKDLDTPLRFYIKGNPFVSRP